MAASFGHLYKTRGFASSPPGSLLLPRVSRGLEQCPRRRFLTTPPVVSSSVTPTGPKTRQRDLNSTPRLPEQSIGLKGSTALESEVRGHELVAASLCVHLPALSGAGHTMAEVGVAGVGVAGVAVEGVASPRLARAKHRLRMSFVDFTQHHHHNHRNHHRHSQSHAHKRRVSSHVHPAIINSSSKNQDQGHKKSQSQPRSLGVLSNDSFPSELNVVCDNKERCIEWAQNVHISKERYGLTSVTQSSPEWLSEGE